MGKGIAVEFRSRFPKMYIEYKRRCLDGRFKLGDVFAWTEAGITIYNLGTQASWKTKAELGAIEMAVRAMVHLAEQAGITKVGLPRIGSGLGGLPWEGSRAMLSEIGGETNVELVVFEHYEAHYEVGQDDVERRYQEQLDEERAGYKLVREDE
jgi:O-acetyl-ADP-ribose deacetylase (regulator of RNase III)